MPIAGDTSNPQQPAAAAPPSEPKVASSGHGWPRGMVWIALGIVLLSLIVATWAIWQQGINARYAGIRARGEPVTFAELDAAYPSPPADRDTTHVLLPAGNMLHASAGKAEWRPLPYIGEGAEVRFGTPWPELELAQHFLTENASALEQLHKAADLGCQARFDVISPSGTDFIGYANPLRTACEALCLEAAVRQHSGDLPAAVQSLAAVITLENALTNEPFEVSQLIRGAIFGAAAFETKRAIVAVDFADADLKILHDALADINFRHGLKVAFLGERVYAMAGGGNEVTRPRTFQNRLSELARQIDAGRCLDFWADFIAATDLPWPQMLDVSRSTATRCAASESRWHQWFGVPTPAMADMVVDALTRAELTRRLLLVAISIERYRLSHGTAPAALAGLVPEFLAEVPDDPTDGSPLSYQATDSGYVLYSKDGEFPPPYNEVYDAETGANPSFLIRRPPLLKPTTKSAE